MVLLALFLCLLIVFSSVVVLLVNGLLFAVFIPFIGVIVLLGFWLDFRDWLGFLFEFKFQLRFSFF